MREAADRPTLAEMLEEIVDLSAGLGVMLLPLLLLAVPGVILFVVLPALLLLAAAAPVAIVAAIIASPYLLVRSLRRRRHRRAVEPRAPHLRARTSPALRRSADWAGIPGDRSA